MNRKSILIYTGVFIGVFVLLVVAIFFLYPYLNEEKYEQVIEDSEQDISIADTDLEYTSREFDYLNNELEQLREEERRLTAKIDSLNTVQERLMGDIEEHEESRENLQAQPADAGLLAATDENKEEFSERVKSLLNLDEQELAPIVNQMTKEELVRLYNGGGNIQREKLLRSLDPKQAAELMKEVML